jgi:hypothetical protein
MTETRKVAYIRRYASDRESLPCPDVADHTGAFKPVFWPPVTLRESAFSGMPFINQHVHVSSSLPFYRLPKCHQASAAIRCFAEVQNSWPGSLCAP